MSKTNKTNYTKGEWIYEYSEANKAYEIFPIDENGEPIIEQEICITADDDEANANRIVDCVNSHDDLLKACKMSLALLDIEVPLVMRLYKRLKTSQSVSTTNRVIKVLNILKEAIAKGSKTR